MLIQKTEKPEGNLVPQHILLVGRGDEAIGNAGNLLTILRTPTYLNRVLMIDIVQNVQSAKHFGLKYVLHAKHFVI